jgi:hypothetical protein
MEERVDCFVILSMVVSIFSYVVVLLVACMIYCEVLLYVVAVNCL